MGGQLRTHLFTYDRTRMNSEKFIYMRPSKDDLLTNTVGFQLILLPKLLDVSSHVLLSFVKQIYQYLQLQATFLSRPTCNGNVFFAGFWGNSLFG